LHFPGRPQRRQSEIVLLRWMLEIMAPRRILKPARN
jgi:hypothetical protein